MPRSPVTRPANDADLDFCVGVSPGIAREVIAGKIAAGDILVACRDADIVGVLRLDWLWCKKPFLGAIEVVADHRGQGIGSDLLCELERRLVARGYDRLISSTMPDNLPSQNWHRKQGFTECGFLAGINAGGVGEIFYTKDLRHP